MIRPPYGVVGIDPGTTGAAAVIHPDGRVALLDLPSIELAEAPKRGATGNYRARKRTDGYALALWLREQFPPGGPKPRAFLEKVGSFGPADKGSKLTMGALMRSFGTVETVIDLLTWPTTYVAPGDWKRYYGLKREDDEATRLFKARSSEMALRLYPDADIRLVAHQNRAEALLIAHYGHGLKFWK